MGILSDSIMTRYKNKDWHLAYEHSRKRLSVFIQGEGCAVVSAREAQLMLKAHFRGPWRMIAAMTKRELYSAWLHYCWPTWERIRVNIFRRPQDEAIAEFEREEKEHQAIQELMKELRLL